MSETGSWLHVEKDVVYTLLKSKVSNSKVAPRATVVAAAMQLDVLHLSQKEIACI